MKTPLELSFQNIEPSEAIKARVEERVERLHRFFREIISCQVSIEAPVKTQFNSRFYALHIVISVPGQELVVSPAARPELHNHEDIYVAIRDAFNIAERQLKDFAGKLREPRRDEARVEPPSAVVARVFPDEGYGFLEALDGREIYFHRNSLINEKLDELDVGVVVHFAEVQGDKGPQASTVRVL